MISALGEELLGNTCSLIFDTVDTLDIQTEFDKCIRQGGKEGPGCWNISMRAAMTELIEDWNRRNFGVRIQNLEGTGDLINHLVWADNIFLIGNSRNQLVEMFTQMTKQSYSTN